jgi:hypothetical protein
MSTGQGASTSTRREGGEAPDPVIVVPPGSPLRAALEALAREASVVVLAGLPGTGKSLLVHQLVHLGRAAGRPVHLLRWDTARPPFEASPAGRAYPQVAGVTHAVIRLAVGVWVRRALVGWRARHPDAAAVLVAEAPLVGHRLIELARPEADRAEPLLAGPSARFVVPVPSRGVRRFLEDERARRMAAPRHPGEREDAPPEVLRDLWRELARVAGTLGLAPAVAPGAEAPYDPDVYAAVYRHLLRHRHAATLPVDTVLDTGGFSAYDLDQAAGELLPEPGEVAAAIREVERRHPAPGAAAAQAARWPEVP